MGNLPTQVIGQAGTTINFSNASAGGDTCATGEDVKLLIKNGAVSSITATIATPGKVDGDLDIQDRVVTVAAGATEGVRVTDRYRDPATGLASIAWSSATSVTAAVIR
ncbi:hypothetical protein [Actinoallomurus iriomotensis]|uniref:Uncharacterized protein n=1 Tax=Actinoallomurus iriomotensis TaxID=478107 RepID=A0A9W6RUC6_9ACTN|nr:hypothetical protein [Actinoallomurus iriomotensis]GLY81838.1 hypothetical protein Airi01_101050 [Actinoallomurus iriomotensis]